jgi:predicted CopG family antitoxin
MRVPETIRVDPDAYRILEKIRKRLIDNGRPGASFSDAIRDMQHNNWREHGN